VTLNLETNRQVLSVTLLGKGKPEVLYEGPTDLEQACTTGPRGFRISKETKMYDKVTIHVKCNAPVNTVDQVNLLVTNTTITEIKR